MTDPVIRERTHAADFMSDEPRLAALCGAMIVTHMAHVVEEALGRFFLIDAVFGLPVFLVLNSLGVGLIGVLFWSVARGQRMAFQLSLVYVAFMGLQGVGHNLGYLATGAYIGGFAGGITGVFLFFISIPLFRALRRARPPLLA